MTLHEMIRGSSWWQKAARTADRHHPADSGVMLSDHLESVFKALAFLRPEQRATTPFLAALHDALAQAGLEPAVAREILEPVALLHDIGRASEEKGAVGAHPMTGEIVALRHPILGVKAALELLPVHLAYRETILALIEEHDTPFAWYAQFKKNGQIPGPRSWARLDRKLESAGNGQGLLLLALLKFADLDGHESVEDVMWFVEHANRNLLKGMNKELPVPGPEALRRIAAGAHPDESGSEHTERSRN